MVNVRMPQDLIDWLDEQAGEDGVPRAEIVRSLVQQARRADLDASERLFDPVPGYVFSARVYTNGRLIDHFSDADPDLVCEQGESLMHGVLIDGGATEALEGGRKRTSSLTLKFAAHRADQTQVTAELLNENYPKGRP
jgi:hypothetical protein